MRGFSTRHHLVPAFFAMHVRPALFAALVGVPVALHAQAAGFGPIVLQLPASTRAIGFGDAYVGVREPEAVFYNPAQLGARSAGGVALSVQRYGSVSTAGSFASSYVFGPFGFGVGAQLLDFQAASGGYPSAAPNGEQLGIEASLAASSLVAATALEMAYKGIRWGVTGKVAQDRVATARDGVLLADVGAAKELGPVTVGATVQNLGASPKLLGTSAALPTRGTVGVSGAGLPVGPLDLATSAAVSVRRGGRVSPAGGVELGYTPIEGITFAGRVGGRLPEKDGQSPATFGATFTFDRLSVDYAFEPYQGKGDGHRIGIRVR
jgi:hypothetical protein